MNEEKVDRTSNADLPLVITIVIVFGVLVDDRSSCNFVYLKTLTKLREGPRDLKPRKDQSPLAFNDSSINPCKHICLLFSLGEGKEITTLDMYFFVIQGENTYNGIFRLPFLATLDAVASLVHLKLKYHDESRRAVVIETDLLGARPTLEVSRKISNLPPSSKGRI